MNNSITDLFKDYDILSLGYNCNFKYFFTKILGQSTETHFFDYIGSSMWAIVKLFETDFEDLLNPEYYKNIKIIHNICYFYLTHTKYYLRFIHDLRHIKEFPIFKDKYERRKNRLYEKLTNNQQLLLFRFEEPMINRVEHPEYSLYFKTTELEYLGQLITLMKNKFNINNIKIIFFSNSESTGYYNNIIVININQYNHIVCKKTHIATIINEHYDFIKNHL